MNYIEEAENLLLYYNDLYRSVENLNREIARLVGYQAPSLLNAIQLEETGIRSSRVEDTYNLLFEIKALAESKAKTELELKQIDRIRHILLATKRAGQKTEVFFNQAEGN